MTRRIALVLAIAAFVGLSAPVQTLDLVIVLPTTLYTSAISGDRFTCSALNVSGHPMEFWIQIRSSGGNACGTGEDLEATIEPGRAKFTSAEFDLDGAKFLCYCQISYKGKGKDAVRGELVARSSFTGDHRGLVGVSSQAR